MGNVGIAFNEAMRGITSLWIMKWDLLSFGLYLTIGLADEVE